MKIYKDLRNYILINYLINDGNIKFLKKLLFLTFYEIMKNIINYLKNNLFKKN